jgi:hypothetical protein
LIKLLLTACGLLFFNFLSLCQETPYYQKPENRKNDWEVSTLPNLKAFVIKYYASAHGSFRKDFLKNQSQSNFGGKDATNLAGYAEFNIGVNRNEKYLFETGFIISHQNLTTYTELSLPFQNDVKSYLIPIKIKRTVLTLDKVSKTGFLMVGLGINTRLKQFGNEFTDNFFEIKYRGTPPDNAIETVNYRLERKVPLFQLESTVEMRGKVTERFELGLFMKSNFTPVSNLKNNVTFTRFNGAVETSNLRTALVSINFGILARINSPRFVEYSSKID